MKNWILAHHFKEMVRSNFWQKNLVVNLLIAFAVFIMCFYLLILGLFIPEIIKEMYPGANAFTIINGGLIFYFSVDLLARFFLIALPKINIESYLHLPIKKSKIINYLLLKSSVNIFNIIPFIVFIPFAFVYVVPNYSLGVAVLWLVLILLCLLNNSFFINWLKRKFINQPYLGLSIFLLIASFVALEKMHVIDMSSISASAIMYIISHPFLILGFVGLLILNYFGNYKYLLSIMTIEGVQTVKRKSASLLDKNFFVGFGEMGDLLMMELKMILRNKRSKSTFMMSPLFLLYGFIFYTGAIDEVGYGMYLFAGIFMSGGIMYNYGLYVFSWESTYFDGILTKNMSSYQHIKTKYTFNMMSIIICYILTTPYAYFGWDILLINTAACLFNLGVSSMFLLYGATYSKTRMEMSRSSSMNFQGMSAMNWLMIIPFFLLPVIIFGVMSIFVGQMYAVAVVGGVGVIFLSMHKIFLKLVVKNYEKRKYIMASGFRERV